MKQITLTQRIGLVIFLLATIGLLAGCSISWIDETTSLLPVIASAVAAFVGLLAAFGTKVPADLLKKVQMWQLELTNYFATLKDLIAQYQASTPGTQQDGILAEIQDVTQIMVNNLQALLPEFHVFDPATQAKVSAVANALLVQIEALAAIIPAVQGQVKIQQVANAGKLPMNAQQFASHFNQILMHGTGDDAVDGALSTLKPLPVPQTKV